MIRRSARVAARITAIAFVAVLVVAAVFVWQAMNGPVSLGGLLTPRLEAMINSGLKDMQLRFGDSVIEWSEGKNLAYLQFLDVEALDTNGNVIARVPRAKLSLSGPALLRGEAAPTRVELIGVNALLVRRRDGGVQLGFQVSPGKAKEAAREGDTSESVVKTVLEAMLRPKPDDNLSRYLTRFAITDAKLTIFDEETRSYWNAEKAALTFDRKKEGVVMSIAAPLRLADKSTWLFTASANYTGGTEEVALKAAFKPVRLSTLAASGAGLKALNGLNITVQGNAACTLAMSGKLGACQLALTAGDGHLTLPALKKDPIHVKGATLTVDVDVPAKTYAIKELTWKGDTLRGRITGNGAFDLAADGALAMMSADWTAENVFIDAPIVFDGGGLALEKATFRGAFEGATKQLTIDEIFAKRGSFELKLAGSLQDHPVSTGVVLNGGFKDLTVADLKRLWPQGAAQGARDWIFANAHEGLIPEGTVAVAITPGAVGDDGRIPDEMMNIAFAMKDMRVTYLAGLPDMTKVNGSATVMGDTLTAEMTGGNIGTLVMHKGAITIPELHKRGTVASITGTMSGPTADILAVLDKPRLGYPTRYGMKPSDAGGKAEVNFTFGIPMLADLTDDQVEMQVDAELKDVRMPINESLRLTGGTFALSLNMKGFKAHGAVQVNTAPMGFTWTEDFTGTAKNPTRIDVTGTINDEHRARLGIDFRPYIEGKTAVVAVFTGKGGKVLNAKVDANLTSARLSSPELDWAKPEDAKAAMKADIAFKADKTIEISNIDAVGQGMRAQGRLVVSGGRIREADFKLLQLGERNDFALLHKIAADGAEAIEVKGRVIDAGGFLGPEAGEEEEPKPKERKHPLAIKADVDLAYLQGDVWFTGVTYTYADDGDRITAFKVDASADAANVRGELVRAPDNSRKLRLQTADAGRLLRATTGFRSLIGGNMVLNAELSPLPPPGSPAAKSESTFDGTLKIENFKIVDQPFFARLLSAGSFTGLDDLLRGEGITFTKLEQVFQGRGDLITLTNGRAAGPAIGLTTQGLVNRDGYKLDLNGTIVPLYGLNSMFEDIPLLGDILNSRKGEGIFGVTYGVSGELTELRVAVNPVSMLAPGFLRKLFQMGPTPQAAAPMPMPAPAAAPPAAPATTSAPAVQPAQKPEAQNSFQPAPVTN